MYCESQYINISMRLHEFETPQTELSSFWDLAKTLKLTKEVESFHDAVLPWLNSNRASSLDKLIKKPKFREASKLQLYFDILHYHAGWGKKVGSLEEFEHFKKSPITLWRGGGGQYDPSFTGNGWFSYTFKEERVKAFSYYNGTRASKQFGLDKRSQFWEVQLTIPVDQILLYLHAGSDSEVIVSAGDSARASLIHQS
jgi:hypothetical protein